MFGKTIQNGSKTSLYHINTIKIQGKCPFEGRTWVLDLVGGEGHPWVLDLVWGNGVGT